MIHIERTEGEIKLFVDLPQDIKKFSFEIKRFTSSEEIEKKRDEFSRLYRMPANNGERRNKLMIKWAYEGLLDNILTKEELKCAREGLVPNWANFHHMIPLNLGGSNKERNLFLTDAIFHSAMNTFWYNPLTMKLSSFIPRPGSKEEAEELGPLPYTVRVVLPSLDRVITEEKGKELFMPEETEKFTKWTSLNAQLDSVQEAKKEKEKQEALEVSQLVPPKLPKRRKIAQHNIRRHAFNRGCRAGQSRGRC